MDLNKNKKAFHQDACRPLGNHVLQFQWPPNEQVWTGLQGSPPDVTGEGFPRSDVHGGPWVGLMSGWYPTCPFPRGAGTLPCDLSHDVFDVTPPPVPRTEWQTDICEILRSRNFRWRAVKTRISCFPIHFVLVIYRKQRVPNNQTFC